MKNLTMEQARAIVFSGDLTDEDKQDIAEVELRGVIKRLKGKLRIPSMAMAIKDGIGEDLKILIKELNKYVD